MPFDSRCKRARKPHAVANKAGVVSGLRPVRTGSVPAPPPGFSQVFILKGLKVLYFDTLLQVFILKVVSLSSLNVFGAGASVEMEIDFGLERNSGLSLGRSLGEARRNTLPT